MFIGQIVVIKEQGEDIYDIPVGGRITIGRSSVANIQIADLSVSKIHCQITHCEDKFLLEDLQSRNFTYLNGDKVETIVNLSNNDLITAGRIDISFAIHSDQRTVSQEENTISENEHLQEKVAEEIQPIKLDEKVVGEIKAVEEIQPIKLDEKAIEEIKAIREIKPVEEVRKVEEIKAIREIKPVEEVRKVEVANNSISMNSLLQSAKSPEDTMLISVIISDKKISLPLEKMADALKLQKKYPKYTLAQILIKMGDVSALDMASVLKTVSDILKLEQSPRQTPQQTKPVEASPDRPIMNESSGEFKIADAPDSSYSRDDEKRLQKLFLKIIRIKGLISQEKLKKCIALHQKYTMNGAPVKFLEILIREKFLTREQVTESWNFVKGTSTYNIDGYQMISLIGIGGMGYIYKARQISMDRLVAIKILSEEYSDNPQLNELFLKEARAVARLNHENIIAGYDFGRRNGFCFFIMEYVDGMSLYEKLKNSGDKLSVSEALEVIIQVAKALEHASARGFVHRDIKPENVLIKKDGLAKLCDLGLAERVDNADTRKKEQDFGTPAFMSPEQIRGETNIDIRSDIYSLGVTFFRTLYGKLPFQGEAREIMAKHLTEKVKFPFEPNSYIEKKAVEIIEKMMTKERMERYQSPSELLTDLTLAKKPEMIEISRDMLKGIEATVAIPKLSRRKKIALRRRRRR